MRRAAKVDATQPDIIDALKRIGVSVEVIGKPVDLLICHRGETSVMEVKSPDHHHKGEGLTQAQIEFIARWPGKVHVVASVEQALVAVLGKAMQ